MAKKVEFEYTPRVHFLPLHQRTQRWACLVCHRRAGKTVGAVNEIVLRALYTKKKNARFAYIAPLYRQGKDIAWEYLKSACEPFVTKVRESELRVILPNGAWITIYGSDNPNTLRGLYLDGAVLDEFGDCRPSLWEEVVRPCLSDRKGWAIFIGTPKGKNHFYKILETAQNSDRWYSLVLKASESGILDEQELSDMRESMSDESYDQEMECNFNASLKGTYYAAIIRKMENENKITNIGIGYNPAYPVKAAADLGRTDSTAFWFWQELPTGIHIIDYEEEQGRDIDFYIDMLNEKPYRYEEIWLPHDAVAKTLATKRSTIEQMLDAGFPCRLTPRLSLQHGIDAVRKMLPKFVIHSENCFYGVEALRAYKRTYNEITKAFMDKPKHDWASDGSDAMRYLCLVCGDTEIDTSSKPDAPTKQTHYDFCLDDLHNDRALRHPNARINL